MPRERVIQLHLMESDNIRHAIRASLSEIFVECCCILAHRGFRWNSFASDEAAHYRLEKLFQKEAPTVCVHTSRNSGTFQTAGGRIVFRKLFSTLIQSARDSAQTAYFFVMNTYYKRVVFDGENLCVVRIIYYRSVSYANQ